MKTAKLIPILTLLFTMVFVMRCSNDNEPAPPLVKISGNITYINPTGQTANAAGAVVYLAKSATATTTYDQTTIADANGVYTFSNLSADSYYLNAIFRTDNKNVTARLDGLSFTTETGAIVIVNNIDVTQDLALVSSGQTGTELIQSAYGWDVASSTYKNTGAWTFDQVHSPVEFQFPYRGQEADFKGMFMQVSKFALTFDAANLASSSIVAEIDLASVNTGVPGGRDVNRVSSTGTASVFQPATQFTGLGCIPGTFGITADPASSPITITSDPDRYATFTSASIEKYGDGYLAKGNLIFNGKTVAVGLIFKYIAPFTDTSVTPNKKYVSFEGKLEMNAKTDFAINSSSVGDAAVIIYITVNLNKIL